MPDTGISRQGIVPLKGKVSEAEWETRVDLAAAFRIAYHFGWNETARNHITARVPDAPDRFLMNPQGLGWHEVTASSLVRADFAGNILNETDFTLAPAGLNFHSAILAARAHINCVLHIHPTAGVVVSATKDGLMHIDQGSCRLYRQVAYHEFEGLAQDKDEAPRIIEDLGDKPVMIMWNHGLLSVGRTIGEAFSYMHTLVQACETQVRLMATGAEIRRIPEEVCEHTYRQMAARRGDAPSGQADWQMHRRLAERLDPAFRD